MTVVYSKKNRAQRAWFEYSLHAIFLEVWRNREIIIAFARRDFSVPYKGAYLGFAWSILSPLVMLGMFTLVFGEIFNGRFSKNPDETSFDFAIALYVGLSLYMCFSQVLSSSATLISQNSIYVAGIDFPVQALPVTVVLNALIPTLINIVLCLLGFYLLNGFVYLNAFLVFIHIFVLVILCLGVAWFISALAVFAQDVATIISPISIVLMFWSLVFFPISSMPASVRWSVEINPLAVIISQARMAMTEGVTPQFEELGWVFLGALVFLVFSYWFFDRVKSAFGDLV